MQYAETAAKLAQYRQQIAELRNRVRELKQSVEPEKVADYEFSTPEGKVHLSELFGEKQYLFVIHNMGAGCRYCTLWADGFNGILPYIENRAGFVLTSPDEAAAQQKFKTGRGWRFRMVSHRDTSFAEDMGYRGKDAGYLASRYSSNLPRVRQPLWAGRRFLRHLAFLRPAARRCRWLATAVQIRLISNSAVAASSLSSDKSPPPRWALDG